eukprot:gnl/Carplike_NY0171/7153_a9870_229.p1 GENE.gnl/Carplike_NY0171/7153_a9870_229~~gnl/Carplike_NY0171/7153_a9870_229.p1  ORF type:complete len:162 (+),score=21.68 gnl/Carplike_NY0171/7153_a9870_229:33-518(+)
MTSIAVKRLMSEIKEIQGGSLAEFAIAMAVETNYELTFFIPGPPDSVYAGESFKLSVLPQLADYPYKPPICIFQRPSPIHPHIYSNGHICLSILTSGGGENTWSPALTITSLIKSIYSIMASVTLPREKIRPIDDESYSRRKGAGMPSRDEWSWRFHDDKI